VGSDVGEEQQLPVKRKAEDGSPVPAKREKRAEADAEAEGNSPQSPASDGDGAEEGGLEAAMFAKLDEVLDSADGELDSFREFLEQHKDTLNFAATDEEGHTILTRAAADDIVELMELLMTFPRAVEAASTPNEDGGTAIELAIECGTSCVPALINAGAVPEYNADSEAEENPLMKACTFAATEVAELLLERNPSIMQAMDENGYNAFQYAMCGEASYDEEEADELKALIKLLVSKAMPTDFYNTTEEGSPLHLAVKLDQHGIGGLFIQAEPGLLQYCNADGLTPKEFAAKEGKEGWESILGEPKGAQS